MKITEAIKQQSFATSKEQAVVNVLYTYNWLRDHFQDLYKEYGLKMQHYNVLRILKGKHPNPVSPGEIKEVMLDKSPDLTRLLDKLVEMNLVNRKVCPENRRRVDVYLTDEGLALLEEMTRKNKIMHEEIGGKLSEQEAAVLSSLLDKLRA